MTTIDLLQIKIEKAKANLPEETRRAIEAVDWRRALLDIRVKKGFTLEKMEDLELETELMLCGLLNPADYQKQIREKMGISPGEAEEIVNEMNERVFKKIRMEFMKILELRKVSAPPSAKGEAGEGVKDASILKSAGIEIMPAEITPPKPSPYQGEGQGEVETRDEMLKDVERPELIKKTEIEKFLPEITSSKLAGTFKIPSITTEYSLGNMTKGGETSPSPSQPHPNQLVALSSELLKAHLPDGQGEGERNARAKLPKIDPYRMDPNE